MNNLLNDYRKKFLNENEICKKVDLSEDEIKKLEEVRKQKGDPLPTDEVGYDYNRYKWFRKEFPDLTESEFNQIIALKTLEAIKQNGENQNKLLKGIDDKINTMKGIMVFWLILTIISLIGSIYTAVKIGEFFSQLSGY